MITRQVTTHQRCQEHVQNLPRSRGAFVFGVRILDLLFVDREGFEGDVMVRGCLGHSDHKITAVFYSRRSKEWSQQNSCPGLPEGRLWPVWEPGGQSPLRGSSWRVEESRGTGWSSRRKSQRCRISLGKGLSAIQWSGSVFQKERSVSKPWRGEFVLSRALLLYITEF